jgi:hypothetical protein
MSPEVDFGFQENRTHPQSIFTVPSNFYFSYQVSWRVYGKMIFYVCRKLWPMMAAAFACQIWQN